MTIGDIIRHAARFRVPAAIISAIALWPASGQAADKGESWFKGHFNSVRDTCYARVYSKKHLARHRRQTVTYIALEHFPIVHGYTGDDDKTIHPSAKVEKNILIVLARFRHDKKLYGDYVFCKTRGDHLECGIECDGGGFGIYARGPDKILIRTGPYGFRVSGCGGEKEDNFRFITRKSDDRAFLLTRQPASRCKAPSKKFFW